MLNPTRKPFQAALLADADKVLKLYKNVQQSEYINIRFTLPQSDEFDRHFAMLDRKYSTNEFAMGVVRRSGLIVARMAGVLTMMRCAEADSLPNEIIIEDADFKTAIGLAEVLIENALRCAQHIGGKKTPIKPHKKQLFDRLDDSFTRQDYLAEANKLKIPPKTADEYIKQLISSNLMSRIAHGKYQKNK